MKRLFTLLILASLVTVSFAQPPIKTLYLMATAAPEAGDLIMEPLLKELGLNVTAEELTPDSPTTDYDLVVLSESPGSGSAGWAHYGAAPLPIVTFKVHALKTASLNWVASGDGVTGVDYDNNKDSVMKVVTAGHEILTGITDTDIQVLDNADLSKALVGWVNMPAGGGITHVCASPTDGVTGQNLVAIDKGTVMNATNTLAKRAVILAFHQESWDFMNDNAKTLLSNACHWAVERPIGGGDAINDYAAVETSIFPNPSTGIVNLEFAESIANLSVNVLAMDGRVVFSQQLSASQNAQLDLSDLNAGVYFIHFEGTDVSYTEKLILK